MLSAPVIALICTGLLGLWFAYRIIKEVAKHGREKLSKPLK